jgi:hypothetical protein
MVKTREILLIRKTKCLALFFLDPGVGPVDDAGCHVQIPSNPAFDDLVFDDDDECDSMQRHHLPTMSDMLIAFPSQKGRIFLIMNYLNDDFLNRFYCFS